MNAHKGGVRRDFCRPSKPPDEDFSEPFVGRLQREYLDQIDDKDPAYT